MANLPSPISHLPALATALLLSACYRYTPVVDAAPVPGTHVRLALTQPADSRLAAILGTQVVAVEGRVLSALDSAYSLSVTATLKGSLAPNAHNRTNWVGEPVTIPRPAVGAIELRSLDRKRTTRGLVLGAVATVVAVRILVVTIGGSGGGDDGGGVITPP